MQGAAWAKYVVVCQTAVAAMALGSDRHDMLGITAGRSRTLIRDSVAALSTACSTNPCSTNPTARKGCRAACGAKGQFVPGQAVLRVPFHLGHVPLARSTARPCMPTHHDDVPTGPWPLREGLARRLMATGRAKLRLLMYGCGVGCAPGRGSAADKQAWWQAWPRARGPRTCTTGWY